MQNTFSKYFFYKILLANCCYVLMILFGTIKRIKCAVAVYLESLHHIKVLQRRAIRK